MIFALDNVIIKMPFGAGEKLYFQGGKENEDQRRRKKGLLKNGIQWWLDDLAETGFGYDNDSCFDNEAELNEAMSAECNWYMPAEQYIF